MTGPIGEYVCWDCLKGRHAICRELIVAHGLDAGPRDVGMTCNCPVCHGNRYVERQPEYDSKTGRYVDPGEPIGELGMGAVAIDETGFLWQLWSFDPRESEPLIWVRLAPALALGFVERVCWSREFFPGRILHPGHGWAFYRSERES